VARVAELAASVPLAVVEKVPAAADRVRREVVLARFIGKLAVDQGVRELRGRLVPASSSYPPTDDAPTTEAPAADLAEHTAEGAGAAVEDSVEPSVSAVAADELALADYDHLSSAQIVSKLSGLEPAERAQIGDYERAHRHRRTILGKLDQLGA
jgi:hypothetical protein